MNELSNKMNRKVLEESINFASKNEDSSIRHGLYEQLEQLNRIEKKIELFELIIRRAKVQEQIDYILNMNMAKSESINLELLRAEKNDINWKIWELI